MPRYIIMSCMFYLFFFLSVPNSGLCTSGDYSSDETAFVARVKNNLLSVKANNVPLNKIMTQIANQTSIKVTLHGSTEDSLSVDFSDLPLEKGLRRLTRSYNTIFIYASGNGEKPDINEVIVFDKTDGSLAKTLRPRASVPQKPRKASSKDLKTSPANSKIKGLRDKDPAVGKNALETAAEAEKKRDIIRLGKVLVADKNNEEKASAAKRLGDLEDERALVPLIQALRDTDAHVQESAADALCRIGGDNVIRALEGCLSGKDEELRKIAVEALERLE